MSTDAIAPLAYRIVQPPGWVHIPIDSTADARIQQLVDAAVATAIPANRAPIRAFLEKQFRDSVAEADRAGAQDFYFPVEPVDGIAIPMSIIVATGPAPDPLSDTAISDALLSFAALTTDAQATEVGGQLAVRSVVDVPAELSPNGDVTVPAARRITYLSAIPARLDRLMLVTASLIRLDGPEAESLVEAMELLFDAMVRTIRFDADSTGVSA